MKKLLSASAAVAALLVAAPAFAGSGHIDVSYTARIEFAQRGGRIDTDFIDVSSWNFGGAAVTGVGAGDWNLQGDATVHRVEMDFFGSETGNYTDAAAANEVVARADRDVL